MVIDHSQASPNTHQSAVKADFEYDYHSADKEPNVAGLETSIQSYSRGIGRHLGSASKQRDKKGDQNVHTDESSQHDKDDIITNGWGQGTNRAQELNFDQTSQA